MSDLERISITVERSLLQQFDDHITSNGIGNRSEAIRDLIRDKLIVQSLANDDEVAIGALTIVYDHHKRELNSKLTEASHHHHDIILSSMHVHLDHDNCLELIALKGKASALHSFSERIITMKGVMHGKLTLTSVAALG